MHWLLDVVWGEDESGILSENGHKTLNAFRKLAVLAHKRHISGLSKKPSVKGNVLAALFWMMKSCGRSWNVYETIVRIEKTQT